MKIRLPFLVVFFATIFAANAGVPEVNVFADVGQVSEGNIVSFIFRKEGAGGAYIRFRFAGTAREGLNFRTSSDAHAIAMPDGVEELRVPIYTFRDTVTNTSLTLVLQLEPDPTYTIGLIGSAATRIVERTLPGLPNTPPGVSFTATQYSDRVDFQIRALDPDRIEMIWLLDGPNILATFSNIGLSSVTTNFVWNNPSVGRHEISAIARDTRGLTGGLSNMAPAVILIGDNFAFPKEGASSTNGVTFTTQLLTTFDNEQRRRRLLLEIPIPASATNGEAYLEFTTQVSSSPARTNEMFTYTGDGVLSTDDLFTAGAFVTKFVAPFGINRFRIDLTSAVRANAGGYLGIWFNADPAQTGPENRQIGQISTRFSDFMLANLNDSVDVPTTARWLNPITAPIPIFEPVTFSFEIVDEDSRVTSVELHSKEAGLLASFTSKGPMTLGTNRVSLTWTNLLAGTHSLVLKTSNEDGFDAAVELGSVTVPAIPATIDIPVPGLPSRPAQNPFPVEAVVVTPAPLTVTAELSVAGGTVVDTRSFDLGTGTNRLTLNWTNPIAGDHTFQIKITDQNTNSTVAISPTITVVELDHEWLYTGDNIQSMHVVDAAGRARVWGYNFGGELGLGFMDADPPYFVATPAVLEPPSGLKWKQIASSASALPGAKIHFALASDGSLWGWGYNGGAIFGTPVSKVFRALAPIKVPFPAGVLWWKKIVCSRNLIAAIDQDGNLWQWGPFTPPTKAVGRWLDVRAQNGSLMALSTNYTLLDFSHWWGISLPKGVKVTREFSTCITHSLAIGSDGQLYGWGTNNNGQLPVLDELVFPETRSVPVEGVESWTQVATTTNLSLAVDNHGRLFSWGSSPNTGARNPIKNKPALVDVPETGWLDVAVNPAFAMALSQAGNLYIWGDIHIDTNTVRRIPFPERVDGLPLLLDPNFTVDLATFDISSLDATATLDLTMIVPTNSPLQLEISNDLQTWRAASTITASSNRLTLSQRMNQETNSFFRIRPVTAAAK